jgi:hypothetical protein
LHAKRHDEIVVLNRLLREERAKRREVQRSVSEFVLATRGELAAREVIEPAMTRSQSSLETRPQQLIQALAQRLRSERALDASPPRISPLPIRMGGNGLGVCSPEKRPVSIRDLHPAAQVRADVKMIERARLRRSVGLGVDASFFDQPRSL